MTNLLKISEAGAIALHTVTYLASEPERVATTAEIANALCVSEAHLSKVLQRLSRAGLVTSARGPKGGHSLARSPEAITLLEVYEAIEGRLETNDCMLMRPACDSNCIMGDLLHKVNALVKEHLSNTRVSDVSSLMGVKNA